MDRPIFTYYVVYEFYTRWLQRKTVMGAVVEVRGGIRTQEDHTTLHKTLHRLAQSEHGKNKAWSLVILNWKVLPGSE